MDKKKKKLNSLDFVENRTKQVFVCPPPPIPSTLHPLSDSSPPNIYTFKWGNYQSSVEMYRVRLIYTNTKCDLNRKIAKEKCFLLSPPIPNPP